MATTPPVVQEQIPAPSKLPVVSMTIAVVLGVIVSVAAIGGAAYMLIHSGKLRLQTMPPPTAPAKPEKTHNVLLEPLVVNLSDSSGSAYLRVSIVLVEVDEAGAGSKEEKKEETAASKGSDAAVRDAAIDVIGRQTAEMLLAENGKEALKKQLRDVLKERLPESRITDLYFTEFLVQR